MLLEKSPGSYASKDHGGLLDRQATLWHQGKCKLDDLPIQKPTSIGLTAPSLLLALSVKLDKLSLLY